MRKQRIISILLTLCMVFALLPTTALAAGADKFTDVSKDSWYYKEVSWVVENGYYKGTSDTTFAPDDAMTRAMFVTVLARYAGAKLDSTQSTFTDVPTGEWYTGAVNWAAKNKIVEGRGNGIFDPHTAVTREEMCTILDRYLKITGETAKLTKTPAEITDLDTVSAYATEAVKNCVAYGVILGYPDGTFGPKLTATRAHVAALLYRLQLKVSGGGGGGFDPTPNPPLNPTPDPVDLTYMAAANLTNYLNGKVGETTVSFPTKEIAYLSAINLQQIDDVAGKKAAEVSIEGRATLTTELVREIYTEAIAEVHVLYDILRAELDGATDTRANLIAELKAEAKDVFAAVGYEPDTATLNAIAEEIYAKVVTLYREIANKTLDKSDINKSGLSTTIETYNKVKDLTKAELSAIRAAVNTAVKTYEGDYAFDTATISVDGNDLFSIDVSNGFVLNYADKFKNSSIDLPNGKRAFVKETAVALAKQMRASNTSSEWSSTVYFNGHVTMALELKDAVASNPAYDCTEVFELSCALSVTDQTGTVQYKYDGGKDYIKIVMPEKIEKEYNEKVPAIWNKLINYVQNNPDILDRFDKASGEPVAVAFAMERSKSSGLNFNIDEIMSNAGNYLTPDAVLGLVNGDDGAVLDVLDKAIVDMVKPEDVDKILEDNEDIDFNLEDLVNDLTTDDALTEGEKTDLKDKIVEVATDAIKDAVKGTEYEDVIDDDMAEYIATSATNQVVTQKAEEMTQKAEEEKAEAEKKQAEAEQGEKLTQEQLDALMKALEEAQNNNADDAEIEELQNQISAKEEEKAAHAAAAAEAKEKANAAAATANRLQTGKEVFAENLAGAKENVQVSGSVGTFVEEIKKNDTVGNAISQLESNRALQDMIKLYARIDTYDELWAVELGKLSKAFKTARFDDLGNGVVENVQKMLNKYALNIPASASLEIGGYEITNDMLQNVRNASSTKELRLAVAELFDAIGGLTLNDFADGEDLTIHCGKYNYTVNLTLVK